MLHRKRHDLPSRLLTSKKIRSPDCLFESGSTPSNQIYHPISNLSLNANTSFISSISSKSSNVVESNIEIIESESVASQFHSQNSEYKKISRLVIKKENEIKLVLMIVIIIIIILFLLLMKFEVKKQRHKVTLIVVKLRKKAFF